MPKKTKKQKLHAATHRRDISSVSYEPMVSVTQSTNETTQAPYVFTSPRVITPSQIHDERLVKKDIVKTVALVVIILGIELLLSRYLS